MNVEAALTKLNTYTVGGVGVGVAIASLLTIAFGPVLDMWLGTHYPFVSHITSPYIAAAIGTAQGLVGPAALAAYYGKPHSVPATTFPPITKDELNTALTLSAHADSVSATAEAAQPHAVAPVSGVTQGSPIMSNAIEGQVANAIIAAAEANQATVISMINAAEGGVEAFLAASLSSFKPNGAILPIVWDAIKPSLVAELAKLEAANPGSVIFAYLDVEAHAFAKSIGG